MDANLDRGTSAQGGSERFRDLEVVKLNEDVRTREGLFLRGTLGTIVFVYEGAAAYEVEFADPQPDVVTLREDQLAAA